MALLQPTVAIYHHPLDDADESLKSQTWTGPSPFAAAKVLDGLFPVVGGGTSSAFGAETEFLSVTSRSVSVISLSATKLVISYRDASVNPIKVKSRVGIVSGTSVTFGTEVDASGVATSTGVGSVALSSTKFVVAYDTGGAPNDAKAKVGTVTGTDITFGAATTFNNNTNGSEGFAFAKLTSTKVVLAYGDNGGTDGDAKVGTISGTDIAFGSAFTYDGGETPRNVQLVALAADKVIVAYKGGSGFGESYVGAVTGTSISWSAVQVFHSADSEMGGLTRISATQFVVAYTNVTPSDIEARVGTVSGSNISYGTVASFSSSNKAFGVGEIDSSRFVVAYKAGDSAGKSRIGSVSGSTITFGTESTFTSNTPGVQSSSKPISTVALNGSVVVAFSDESDGDHGTVNIGTLSSAASLTGISASYDSVIGSTKLAYTGWLKNPSA